MIRQSKTGALAAGFHANLAHHIPSITLQEQANPSRPSLISGADIYKTLPCVRSHHKGSSNKQPELEHMRAEPTTATSSTPCGQCGFHHRFDSYGNSYDCESWCWSCGVADANHHRSSCQFVDSIQSVVKQEVTKYVPMKIFRDFKGAMNTINATETQEIRQAPLHKATMANNTAIGTVHRLHGSSALVSNSRSVAPYSPMHRIQALDGCSRQSFRGQGGHSTSKYTSRLSLICQKRGFNPFLSTFARTDSPGINKQTFRGVAKLGNHTVTTAQWFATVLEAREMAAKEGFEWMSQNPNFSPRRNESLTHHDKALLECRGRGSCEAKPPLDHS